MIVRFKPSALKQGQWYEYVVRFGLGGATTVVTGVIADSKGAAIGGLFLAFPAVLCATATLVEAHERREKRQYGLNGQQRGTDAAALEAAGAALGSIGLASFALTVWLLTPFSGILSLGFGSIVWLFVSVTSWRMRHIFRAASSRLALSVNVCRRKFHRKSKMMNLALSGQNLPCENSSSI